MPVTVGIFIQPGVFKDGARQPELRVRHALGSVRAVPPRGDPAGGREDGEAPPRRGQPRDRGREQRRHLRLHRRLGAAGRVQQGALVDRQLHQHRQRQDRPRGRAQLRGAGPQDAEEADPRLPPGRRERSRQRQRQLAARQPDAGEVARVRGVRLPVRARPRLPQQPARPRHPARTRCAGSGATTSRKAPQAPWTSHRSASRISTSRVRRFRTRPRSCPGRAPCRRRTIRAACGASGCGRAAPPRRTSKRAVARRAILRTWPMRGTLHFVAAADVRWMLDLLAPRVIAATAGRRQQLELDTRVFTRSRKVIVKALEGDRQVTRSGLYQLLEAAGISTRDGRGLHILMHFALEGLVCFGAREGKQPTFALLAEWAPHARSLRSRRGACRTRAPVLHQPRARNLARLRMVVGAAGGRRERGHPARPHPPDARRPERAGTLVRARPRNARASAR